MLNNFTQYVFVVGRLVDGQINMLGTAFIVSSDGCFSTPRHVIGDDPSGLVLLLPKISNISDYQDTTDNTCRYSAATILEVDPCKDIAILKSDLRLNWPFPKLGSFDELVPGEEIEIYGYPHCVTGRNVLTVQKAEIGSKVLLSSKGVKSKHAVINTQSRPGQSGSMIYSRRLNQIVGMLIGTYVPPGAGVVVGGINPHELNQTTQCISAHYIKEML
ncbi:hypothetical protein A1OQ_06670 [Enterovibrio norvegicus FF-162]|uniref:S1 family peptidase n=1 Tax=Enterovibrio norvegicus TaxID=188144 RepID=UPI00037147A0|nr:serine protease [Enterovibrio norvegicus]OEE76196.1 hypothetical protein A1OQ_06670 [Enterovibrio norvegicus FF-162]